MIKKDATLIGLFIASIMVFCVGMYKFKSLSTPTENTYISQLEDDKFTPEQKQIINEIRKATYDLNVANENLKNTKVEIQNWVNQITATAIANHLDTNVETFWGELASPHTNGGTSYIMDNNGKPILYGLRQDGLMMWKVHP